MTETPLMLYMSANFDAGSTAAAEINVNHHGRFAMDKATVASALIAFAEEVMERIEDDGMNDPLPEPQPRGERALQEEVE